MPLYKVTVKYSVGSAANARIFTNVFHIQSGNAITSDTLKTADIDPLAAALRAVLVDTCYLKTIVVHDTAYDGEKYHPEGTRPFKYNQQGQKATGTNGSDIKEVVVNLAATGASGRPGGNKFRMFTLETEVVAGPDGEPSAPGTPSGVAALVAALNGLIGNGIDFQIYSRKKGQAPVTRSVVSYVYTGVSARKTTAKRRKKKVTNSLAEWTGDLKTVLETIAQAAASYTLIKETLPALAKPIASTVMPLLEGASSELPALLALL